MAAVGYLGAELLLQQRCREDELAIWLRVHCRIGVARVSRAVASERGNGAVADGVLEERTLTRANFAEIMP